MLWLQTPPWGRWIAAALIAVAALWVEFRPPATTPHLFALTDIPPGSMLDQTNTELRDIPVGLIDPVEAGGVATRPIRAGDPLLPSDTDLSDRSIPSGWWQLELAVPRGAEPGDEARLVLIDTGVVASGVVVLGAEDDPFGSGLGLIAVEPERATDVAAAAEENRVAILIAQP